MRNINFKYFIQIFLGFSGIVCLLIYHIGGLNFSKWQDYFSVFSKVVTIDLIAVMIFMKWGWKHKCLKGWLVLFPDLSGSWTGHIQSQWIDPKTGEKIPEIPIMLTISQSFIHISCIMRTGEMESSSYSENFLIDTDRQIKRMTYSYSSKTRISVGSKSIPHDGTVVLNIVEKPYRKLVGRYWTDRLTKGEIVLQFYSKDILEELPDDFDRHPNEKI